MHDLTCAEVFDAAPQFALDILEASRRSEVAAHLIRCPGCREAVAGMQASAAELLDLDGASWGRVPVVEPAGAVPAPLRPGRRRFRLVVTMAAAAALMMGSALGPEIEAAASHHRPAPTARAELLDGSVAVGYVDFYAGRRPALDVQVTRGPHSGRVVFETLNLDGTVTPLGSFGLYDGRGYWSMASPLDLARVSSLALVDPQGRVLASASLSGTLSDVAPAGRETVKGLA